MKLHILFLQVFGIDNILARVADPLWCGHLLSAKASVSNKTCLKTDAHEKIGIMCLRGGKAAVTEYTELTKDMVERERDGGGGGGKLEYCYGNLAMHQFSGHFMAKMCMDGSGEFPLPIHVARKKIAHYDAKSRRTVAPQENNGVKLEFFVFDTFRYSDKCTVFNIERDEEFAPVKNAKGKDSPLTARVAHSRYWKKRVVACGGKFKQDGALEDDALMCEVSPLFGYLPYGDDTFHKRVQGKTFVLPVYLS